MIPILKWTLVGLIASLAVFLGGMAAAWRRACIRISKQVVGSAAPKMVQRFTPKFVSNRQGWALLLLLAATILAWVLFTWKVALTLLVGTVALMELTAFLYPRSDSQYYVPRVIQDLESWYRVHTHLGEYKRAEEVQRSLEVLNSAYRAGDLSAS